MKLVLDAAMPGFETVPALEVERIYLQKDSTGKGVGKQLMQLAMEKANGLKKGDYLFENNRLSIAAIEFYKKLGFRTCGSLQLPMPEFALMKEEFRGMLIMKKDVIPE